MGADDQAFGKIDWKKTPISMIYLSRYIPIWKYKVNAVAGIKNIGCRECLIFRLAR